MKLRSASLAMILVLGLLPPSVSAGIDSDGDGVPDDRDECPQTPPNTPVDSRGCALKKEAPAEAAVSDVPACPLPPAGAVVDSYGCAVDEDADGVPDGLDQCPHTTRGMAVDAKGCVQALAKETAPAPARPGKKMAAKKLSEPLPAIPDVAPRQPAAAAAAPETTAIAVTEPVTPVAVEPPPPAPAAVVPPLKPAASKPESALSKLARGAEAPAPLMPPKQAEAQQSALPAAGKVEPVAAVVAPAIVAAAVDPSRYAAVPFATGSAELSADALGKLEVLAHGFVQASSAKSGLKLEIKARASATGDGRRPEVLAQERFDLVSAYLQAQGVARTQIAGGTQIDRGRSAKAQLDGRLAEVKVIE